MVNDFILFRPRRRRGWRLLGHSFRQKSWRCQRQVIHPIKVCMVRGTLTYHIMKLLMEGSHSFLHIALYVIKSLVLRDLIPWRYIKSLINRHSHPFSCTQASQKSTSVWTWISVGQDVPLLVQVLCQPINRYVEEEKQKV